MNPLSKAYSEATNLQLVKDSLSGQRAALNDLIQLHQPFIYNVAWKMCHDPVDAEDLTQEVLIKVITKLGQFNFKSNFRTWLYRIVVNEFLQSKRRKGEQQFSSFEDYGAQLDQVPNADLTIEEAIEQEELSKEMQIRCMSGMIMCLNREQRLIFILGDSFGIDHQLGAEIFDISPQNFRIKLHRARKDLFNYMNNKCGLVNKENPCRCPKKAKTLRKMGMLDEKELVFNIDSKTKIADYVAHQYQEAREEVEVVYSELFQAHPVRDQFDKDTIIKKLIKDNTLLDYFNFP